MVHQCGGVISEKELQLLWVWQLRSPHERLPKGNRENHQEVGLNLREGMAKKAGQSLQKLVVAQKAIQDNAP